MADVNLIAGDDRSNSLHGSLGADLIYGWNPDGPQGSVSTITATRVASSLRSCTRLNPLLCLRLSSDESS